MSYAETTLVIDGVEEEVLQFTDDLRLSEYMLKVASRARRSGQHTQLFLIEHGHAMDFEGECCCVQYLTDHHPIMEVNAPC